MNQASYPLTFLSQIEVKEGWEVPGRGVLVCPVCQFYYAHPHPPEVIDGEDDYKAWAGRGSLIRLRFEGECGHSWALCFGFHKGQVIAFWERGPDAVETKEELEGGGLAITMTFPGIPTESFR